MNSRVKLLLMGGILTLAAGSMVVKCGTSAPGVLDELEHCSGTVFPDSAEPIAHREDNTWMDGASSGVVTMLPHDLEVYKSQFHPNTFEPGVPGHWMNYWAGLEGSDALGRNLGNEHLKEPLRADGRYIVIHNNGSARGTVFIQAFC